jgi:hypothetical protein
MGFEFGLVNHFDKSIHVYRGKNRDAAFGNGNSELAKKSRGIIKGYQPGEQIVLSLSKKDFKEGVRLDFEHDIMVPTMLFERGDKNHFEITIFVNGASEHTHKNEEIRALMLGHICDPRLGPCKD